MFSGVVGLVVLVALIALAIAWILLPVMICQRLDRIAKSVAAIEKAANDGGLVQRNFFSDVREAMHEKSEGGNNTLRT